MYSKLQWWLRIGAGFFFLVVGCFLLIINSGLLSRGAARWADEWYEKVSYGMVAAAVPWFIAAMPVVIAWLLGLKKRTAALICGVVWGLLIAYNLFGMLSAIGGVRDDVTTHRQFAADRQAANASARARLQAEFDAIPKHRPVASLEALIKAEKIKPQWEDTRRCRDANKGSEIRFCKGLADLDAELAAGKRAQEILPQLTGLEAKFESQGPASKTADTSAKILSALTGWEEGWLQTRIPILTPIILEILSALSWYLAAVFFGITHVSAFGLDAGHHGSAPGRQDAPPQSGKAAGDPTRQRELCEWYFSTHARLHPAGTMAEDLWYQDYCEVCASSRDVPLPREAFRSIAGTVRGLTIKPINGRTIYEGVLPMRESIRA